MRMVTLEKVAKIDRKAASQEECRLLPYVGLEHIEKDTGRFVPGFQISPEALLAAKLKFSSRHVLYGKLRPYLNKVALPNFDGVCTTEILPILPMEGVLDRTYLWALLLSPAFVEWASAQVSGANLPRLAPELLAKYGFTLPSLPEQQRIAAILARADRLRRLRRYALELSEGYLQAVFVGMFGDPESNPHGWEKTRLSDIALINPPLPMDAAHLSPQEPVSFIPMAAVDEHHPVATAAETKPYSEVAQGYTRFAEGDILFAKITPCMENGKIAIASGLRAGLGFGSTEFHILRTTFACNRHWLLWFVRRDRFRDLARRSFTGTAGQQRVPAAFLESYIVPVPPVPLQERFASVAQRTQSLRAQQREALRQAEQLFAALLDRAFRGALQA